MTTTQQPDTSTLNSGDMTSVLGSSTLVTSSVVEDSGDITLDEISRAALSNNEAASPERYPVVVPDNPKYVVPDNPLLPPDYNEIVDYNSIQYMVGFFRTQIGRYVKVQQLIGSNISEEYDGFLIAVGINYIILQDYDNENVRILDIYGIKNMYVYYAEISNPFTGAS